MICELCGQARAIDPHHIMGGSGKRAICQKLYEDKGIGVINVCRKCHRLIHDNPAKYEYLKHRVEEEFYQAGGTKEEWYKMFGKYYI